MTQTRLFGHGPEDGTGPTINTLESFGWCREHGVDGVELDVRRTIDDQLVVVHDARIADGRLVAQVERTSMPQFVPELDQVLSACTGMTVNIEIKNFTSDPCFDPAERITDLVVNLLEARGGNDDVLISCFGLGSIDRVRSRAPALPTGFLLLSRRPAAELLDAAVEHGHAIVHPYDTMVDEAFMEAAVARGLEVNVWFGDVSRDRLRELVALGVDGLITSDVKTARAVLDERG